MPDSRRGRAWFPMLVALVALLAFTPQAGATEFEDEPDSPAACAAHEEHEDSCSTDDPDTEEPVDEPDSDEPDEPKEDFPGSDGAKSCEDGPVARSSGGSEHAEQFEDGCLPAFVRRFITRVWKFVGEVDYYEEGVLSMTMHKILNLPRKWRTQDDDLIDQDTTVLVGERVERGALDAANDVRVHGKLLRPFRWHEDEDGEPVPTIRAKKVYITG